MPVQDAGRRDTKMTGIPSRQLEQAYNQIMERAGRQGEYPLAIASYGRAWRLERVGACTRLFHYGTCIMCVTDGRCEQVLCTSKSDRDAINGLAFLLERDGGCKDRVRAWFEDGWPVATVNGVRPDTPMGWFQSPQRMAERDIQGARGCE